MQPLSDFRRRKFQLYFELYDFDEDGLMSFYDYLALANRTAEVSGWPEYCQSYWKLYDNTLMKWRIIQTYSHRADQKISLEEWLAYAAEMHLWRDLYHQRATSGKDAILNAMIDMLDPEHTGIIHATSWSKFTAAWGVLGDPQKHFRRIDRYGNRQITHTELMSLLEDFFFSDDPKSIGSYLFGDIPHYASI